jgi:3-methyladenine DNA glycosylase AlkD
MWEKVFNQLETLKNPEKAIQKTKYFKVSEGQYGEGDIFWGLTNPQVHAVAKENFKSLELSEVSQLLKSEIHEVRFAALSILVLKYKKLKDSNLKKEIVNFYLDHIPYINNWDLVDCSTHYIIGPYFLEEKDKSILIGLAESGHLWSERIAIISMLHFVKEKSFDFPMYLIEKLLFHKHDLMHKANGWVLREIWQKGGNELVEKFLLKHISNIPRTTLRYAIEKFPEEKRKYYLALK